MPWYDQNEHASLLGLIVKCVHPPFSFASLPPSPLTLLSLPPLTPLTLSLFLSPPSAHLLCPPAHLPLVPSCLFCPLGASCVCPHTSWARTPESTRKHCPRAQLLRKPASIASAFLANYTTIAYMRVCRHLCFLPPPPPPPFLLMSKIAPSIGHVNYGESYPRSPQSSFGSPMAFGSETRVAAGTAWHFLRRIQSLANLIILLVEQKQYYIFI